MSSPKAHAAAGLCGYRLSGQGLCPQHAVPNRKFCETHLCEWDSGLEEGRCHRAKLSGGRAFCRSHQQTHGMANPAFTTGRDTRYGIIPGALRDGYDSALRDPQLLDLHRHIALIDAKLSELQRNQAIAGGANNPTPPWLEIRELVLSLAKALTIPTAARQDWARLQAIVTAGAMENQTWAQVVTLMEQLRRLAETQTKRDEKLGEYVPKAEVRQLALQLGLTVRRHVSDPHILAAIQHDMARLLTGAAGAAPVKLLESA